MEPFKSSKALKGKKKIVIAHHYTSRFITLKGTEGPKIPVTGHRGPKIPVIWHKGSKNTIYWAQGSKNTSYLAQGVQKYHLQGNSGVQKYQLQGTGGPKKKVKRNKAVENNCKKRSQLNIKIYMVELETIQLQGVPINMGIQ